ncbi:MAG: hypothetical protein NTY19_44150 [Planctomycetota bacterium]|nr:hypothetical protein [Planctomycetota bacterium]
MDLKQVKMYIRQAKAIIPRGGIYGDMHVVLSEVLNMESKEVVRDIERVRDACKPLPWVWAQAAEKLLENAVNHCRDEPASPPE